MGWKLKSKSGGRYVWACDFYTDLQLYNINNLAEYGQPFDPYEPGFDHDFHDQKTKFDEIEIELPQSQVMFNGYGRNLALDVFPVIKGFLSGRVELPSGTYSFDQMIEIDKKFDYKYSTIYLTNLYWKNLIGGIDSGEVSRPDAAYVHGSVWFYLPRETITFQVSRGNLSASAEIRAIDDKWNFISDSSIINKINPLVAALFGPAHNNMAGKNGEPGKITLTYTGQGRKEKIEKRVTAFPH